MITFNYKLPAHEWASILKGAALAAAGAGLTALTAAMSGADLGIYGPFIGAVLSVAANFVRKAATVPPAEEKAPPTL